MIKRTSIRKCVLQHSVRGSSIESEVDYNANHVISVEQKPQFLFVFAWWATFQISDNIGKLFTDVLPEINKVKEGSLNQQPEVYDEALLP